MHNTLKRTIASDSVIINSNKTDVKGQPAKHSVSRTSYIRTMKGKKNLTLLK